MKKIVFLTIVYFGSIFTGFAQNTDLIYGKWVFEDVTEKEKSKLDSAGIANVPTFFKSMVVFLNKNGRYYLNFRDEEEIGDWNWSENQKMIDLVSDDGNVYEMNVVKLVDSQLVVKIQKGKFILSRENPTKEDLKRTVSVKDMSVSATLEQVAKKWYLKSREGTKISARQAEIDKMLSKDLYIRLHKNGKFEAEVLVVEDRASWAFGVDNKSIIVTAEGRKEVWEIRSITDKEMILIRGKTKERWIFTSAVPWH